MFDKGVFKAAGNRLCKLEQILLRQTQGGNHFIIQRMLHKTPDQRIAHSFQHNIMNIFQIAEKLTTGDGKPMTTLITVIPGWTVEDIANKLVQQGVLKDSAEFLELCRTGKGLTDYTYIQDELKTQGVADRKYLLEGYLSPNTYEVYTNATPTEILKKLLDQTDAVFSLEWQERADELNLTIDQTLTLASLIEKEAKTPDFAKVSAVFHNRLKANMKLGSDVTIHYITGERRMSLRNSDLAINSPYNTYLYTGLPLGPICNPSADAINAALYPDETFLAEKYLYFCSKDPSTGELAFSKTQAEHAKGGKLIPQIGDILFLQGARQRETPSAGVGKRKVFRNRHIRSGALHRILKQDADLSCPTVLRLVGNILPVEADVPLIRPKNARNRAKQRAFACAVGTEDGHKVPVAQGQINPIQRCVLVYGSRRKGFGKPSNFKHGFFPPCGCGVFAARFSP